MSVEPLFFRNKKLKKKSSRTQWIVCFSQNSNSKLFEMNQTRDVRHMSGDFHKTAADVLCLHSHGRVVRYTADRIRRITPGRVPIYKRTPGQQVISRMTN